MRSYMWTLVCKPRLCLPKPFSNFFSSQYICLSGSSGRTGEPGEDVVDINTGLMICNASHENIFLGDLNVPGKPSEGQLTNCWIRVF